MRIKKYIGSSKKVKYVVIAAAIIAIVVTVVLVTVLRQLEPKKKFRGAAVTNGPECSVIARNIMAKGGTVADAAIAALFCEGVTMPQSMSLGAGFLLTFYNRTSREVKSLNCREVAPAAATEDMFLKDSSLSQDGGLAIAVPGELRGYWELYNKHGGGVPWKDLVQPTIDLCINGIKVTEYIAYVLKSNKDKILTNPLLSEIFVDNYTKDVYLEGDFIYRKRLAKTLEIIAEEGGEALNNGSLTKSLVQDIEDNNGIITTEDLNDYSPQWQDSVNISLNGGHTVLTQPLPGSGLVLSFILQILDNYLDLENISSIDNYQKIVESFKHGFAQRTLLGDPDFVNVTQNIENLLSKEFAESIRSTIRANTTSTDYIAYGANMTVPEDHGTANLAFLAPNGDAIVVTSTINNILGSGVVSQSTGIIMNNQMDDFSIPNMANAYGLAPSPANFIEPGKRPLSSMCPTIIIDENGDVEMLVGAAGGSKIITSVAQVIIRHLWYGATLQKASDFKRLHHQLSPMEVDLEPLFKTEDVYVSEGLKNIGHPIVFVDGRGFAAATSITTRDGTLPVGVWDKRRSGSASYL